MRTRHLGGGYWRGECSLSGATADPQVSPTLKHWPVPIRPENVRRPSHSPLRQGGAGHPHLRNT